MGADQSVEDGGVIVRNLTVETIPYEHEDGWVHRYTPDSFTADIQEVHTDPIVNTTTGITTYITTFGSAILPDEVPNTYLLVSRLVRLAAPHRLDLLSPGNLIRDTNGTVICCNSFDRNPNSDEILPLIPNEIATHDLQTAILEPAPENSVRNLTLETIVCRLPHYSIKYEPCGLHARVNEYYSDEKIEEPHGLKTRITQFGICPNLPAEEPNTTLIVSHAVLRSAPHRKDLVSVSSMLRNSNNKYVTAVSFSRNRGIP